MEQLITFFTHNWQRKLVAFLAAAVIWLFVNHSITEIKTIPNIPIRVVNLPANKTIPGLMPNGVLAKRVTLTLSGTKEIIDELEPGDMEVLLDASTADQDDWIVQISKKNLVSLNPSIDLLHHINQVNHNDFIIKLSPLVTAKIPVTINAPEGEAPKGYEFLDIWPQHLTQTVSGPQSDIDRLKEIGLELTFNLNEISKIDLDNLKGQAVSGHNDEVAFLVPKKWKHLSIPFRQHIIEELNDPDAQNLRVNFLRKNFLPLERSVPIRVYYPLETLDVLNPETAQIAQGRGLEQRDHLMYVNLPFFAADVSKLFLDVVRNNLELVVIAAPRSERDILQWSLQVIDPKALEDAYVAASIGAFTVTKFGQANVAKKQESMLRRRFKDYLEKFSLYLEQDKKLKIRSYLQDNQIIVEFP